MFSRVERPIFVELFSPLVGLEGEWRMQGASEDEINMTAFDFDHVRTAREILGLEPNPEPGWARKASR